jgi:hypothetical protein
MPTKRIKYLIAIAGAAAAIVALATVTLTSGAEPDSDAAKQPVAKQGMTIVSTGVQNASGAGDFVLTPLEPGALTRDSGTVSAGWSEHVVTRDGQRVAIERGVETFEGRQGNLEIRFRIEWVDAGSAYHAGTGTWKVVGGTGQYDQVAGGGRSGHMWRDRGRGPWSGRADGFLTVPVDSPAKAAPSHEQKIQRTVDRWAPPYAAGRDAAACELMAQPACIRLTCETAGGPHEPLRPVANCTPPSAEFRQSFADATVERIAIRGERSAAELSNGERVEFFWVNGYAVGGVWWIRKVGGDAGHKIFEDGTL